MPIDKDKDDEGCKLSSELQKSNEYKLLKSKTSGKSCKNLQVILKNFIQKVDDYIVHTNNNVIATTTPIIPNKPKQQITPKKNVVVNDTLPTYNITEEHCNKLARNPGVNPITGAKIKVGGPTHKKLKALCAEMRKATVKNGKVANKAKMGEGNVVAAYSGNMAVTARQCEMFRKNPKVNPLTGRAIKKSTNSKSIYAQLTKICADMKKPESMIMSIVGNVPPLKAAAANNVAKPFKEKGNNAVPMKKTGRTPRITTVQRRANLLLAIKKVVAPIINKGDSNKSRIAFHGIMQNYLKNIQPCVNVDKKANTIYLYNKGDPKNPVVTFDRRIGSESKYGIAYMNMGKGFAKLLKFSCKVMKEKDLGKDEINDNAKEISILKHVTNLVIQDYFPNFPIMYSAMMCNNECREAACPKLMKSDTGYRVIINELADSDLQNWLKKKHSAEDFASVLTQMMFAIYAYHGMGLQHNDTHLGNFLIHKVTPGGWWRYRFEGQDVYVPNTGHLVVLWDMGLSDLISGNWRNDFTRPLSLIASIGTGAHDLYDKELKLAPAPRDIVSKYITNVRKAFVDAPYERAAMRNMIGLLSQGVNDIGVKTIQVGGSPPGRLLNIMPYNLDASVLLSIDMIMKETGLRSWEFLDKDGIISIKVAREKLAKIGYAEQASHVLHLVDRMKLKDLLLLGKDYLKHKKFQKTPTRVAKEDRWWNFIPPL